MYSSLPQVVYGFHGCDKSVADRIVQTSAKLRASENDYDWLGHGIYFWENNPRRALEFAVELRENGWKPIETPAVIGAVIDLGYCLNLLESSNLSLVKDTYELFKKLCAETSLTMPLNKRGKTGNDLLLRRLDCAVIQTLHQANRESGKRPFDSVRAVFVEGDGLYPGAGFHRKNHIQICVRNPNCIKGYFHPRKLEPWAHT